eukprot:scaffold13039_cov101-Isochrysis_galbana.AAC.5
MPDKKDAVKGGPAAVDGGAPSSRGPGMVAARAAPEGDGDAACAAGERESRLRHLPPALENIAQADVGFAERLGRGAAGAGALEREVDVVLPLARRDKGRTQHIHRARTRSDGYAVRVAKAE